MKGKHQSSWATVEEGLCHLLGLGSTCLQSREIKYIKAELLRGDQGSISNMVCLMKESSSLKSQKQKLNQVLHWASGKLGV